ncbi:hypothetical protein ONR57_04665 [Hoyosella sp. YIM 151337]|uniref:hypothetical protein n=1 Tax=Hoyosella sp. YIM 151337 TaxID=2992742 RepID=UPI0022368AAA|nr:hypothetical protein [Hoyosella sp. YIM 151337]MCW4352591.1 hypothetical protein [Hoyosella sp. YIM 151337]
MTVRTLFYDGGCASCAAAAKEAQEQANGWLTIRNLNEAESQAYLDAHVPGWKFEPMLVIDEGGQITARHGAGMFRVLLRGLGAGAAFRILRMIGDKGVGGPVGGTTRRSALKGVLGGAAVVAGLATFPATAAARRGRPLNDRETTALLEGFFGTEAGATARTELESRNYELGHSGLTGFEGPNGEKLVLAFFASAADPEAEAAGIAIEWDGSGSRHSLIETFRRGATPRVANEQQGVELPSLETTFSRQLEPGAIAPRTPQAYFNCVVFCVGGQCGTAAARCRLIPHLAAQVACIAGVCGWRVWPCHRTCQPLWGLPA